MDHHFDELRDFIGSGNAKMVEAFMMSALKAGADPRELLRVAVDPGAHFAERYDANEYFVPEILIIARAVRVAVDVLNSHVSRQKTGQTGRVVIGTVRGDLHDIGKRVVASMLQCRGFDVQDLGFDVPEEKFVEAAREKDGTLLALSSLLTTTMTQMRDVLTALQKAGLRDRTKVMVGGAGVTQQFADEIGADGFAANAWDAGLLAEKLVRKEA